ncbi:mpv17-like protein 2 [Sitophilus oryzae]|uniref:Mpv17-like protein 2 n=1 Tax=Sitophilus oryzae TaxID=7048 RepID=A0A6J2XEX3_SITOR|nr:mpv17-like protein 2 [Sitophilus oryzae]XP_030749894.1 mpv17-like protein 2 [Sitophilus oryzae]
MFKLSRNFRYIVRTQTRNVSTTSNKRSAMHNLPSLVFGKYLLHTNIISSGVLMWLGDICEQEIEYRRGILAKRYDYGRMTRMFLVGLGLGPIHHYYYLYIARIWPKRDFSTITKKLALDQFLMGPLCICTFFYTMGALERKPVQQMNDEITSKFLDVYLIDWCVWVPTQFINFYFVPVKYQVFYINAVTMFYNVFLSYIKHKDVEYLKMGDTT